MTVARKIVTCCALVSLLCVETCSSSTLDEPLNLHRRQLKKENDLLKRHIGMMNAENPVEIESVSLGKKRKRALRRGTARRKGALLETKSYVQAESTKKNNKNHARRRTKKQLRRKMQSCVSSWNNLKNRLQNASRNTVVNVCKGTIVVNQNNPINVRANSVTLRCRSKPCRINKQNRPQRLLNWSGDSGTIEDMEFMNVKNNNGNGGVILFSGGGVHSVIRSTFKNNRGQKGGAIYANRNAGLVEIINSRFQNNRANTGGAAYVESGNRSDAQNNGGNNNNANKCNGIYYQNNGQCVNVNNGNTGGGGGGGGNNGCVSSYDNLVNRLRNGNTNIKICNNEKINVSGELRVTRRDTTISCNNCELIGSGSSRIFYVTAENVSFQGLKMTNGYAISSSDGGHGGAIYLAGNNAEIINCDFDGNRGNNGGAIYGSTRNNNSFAGVEFEIRNCDFKNNNAQLEGGAAFFQFVPDATQVSGRRNTGSGNSAGRACPDFFNAVTSNCESLSRS